MGYGIRKRASNIKKDDWGGDHSYFAGGSNTITKQLMETGAANGTNNYLHMVVNVNATTWAAADGADAMFLKSDMTLKDISSYTGMDFWLKGSSCNASQVEYRVQLLTPSKITDSTYFYYKFTPTATWQHFVLPFNSASWAPPTWGGQGLAIKNAAGFNIATQILPFVTAVNFVITASNVPCTCGPSTWDIDEVKFY